jgi:hypothetical protein
MINDRPLDGFRRVSYIAMVQWYHLLYDDGVFCMPQQKAQRKRSRRRLTDFHQHSLGRVFASTEASFVRVVLVAVLCTVPYGSLAPLNYVFSKEHILLLPVL